MVCEMITRYMAVAAVVCLAVTFEVAVARELQKASSDCGGGCFLRRVSGLTKLRHRPADEQPHPSSIVAVGGVGAPAAYQSAAAGTGDVPTAGAGGAAITDIVPSARPIRAQPYVNM